ncbi:hypothetical protein [Streptomyces albidoflavus]|uniref:hypothetical protein n=1 Tax=Streptomyces albidoflavus TaxID=1886 RepID=UPI00101E280F|nr:hypothetical protein [Streptomyces albidoflavus]RZE88593.1 hypothetical protein C0R04_23865 [Streptomyces albidoflavus]RZE92202.1 hypothetical protein C0R03_23875 [Streptomyces albidoflavus]
MPKQSPDGNQEHEDGRAGRAPHAREAERPSRHEITEADRKGGPGHTVLLALALAIPAVKVAYTLGGGGAATDALMGMGPGNWWDVLLGMVLTTPLLACVLGVVASRVVFALFAARGAVPRGDDPAARLRRAGLTVLNPVATGVVVACFIGPWWGLGTAVAAYLLRRGVVIEYRTGRRGRRHHDPHFAPPGWQRRLATWEQVVALTLSVVVLPLLGVVSALDGQAWTSVVRCEVSDGARTRVARLIELQRQGNGVVGWNLDQGEVSNGVGCTGVESRTVRAPWWRA